MHTSIELLIDRQLRRWELERKVASNAGERAAPRAALQPVITVSRQHGSSGAFIAAKLAERFNYTLLHRDMLDRMCESTGYGRRLLESLDEHTRSQLAVWFESMFQGKYMDRSDYIAALFKTVYSIAQLGGVVVVGRGANFIVGLQRGFHIRVVAPREVRIRALMVRRGLPEKDAAREVATVDHERAEFMRKVFGRSVDDPLGYDLVINHVTLSLDTVVSLVAAAALEKFEKLRLNAAAEPPAPARRVAL
jgi:cytidylate kinase